MAVFLDSANSLVTGGASVTDGTLGGQQGLKRDSKNWVNYNIYVKQKMRAVLLSAPGGFRFLPDPEYRVKLLKAFVELHATSINGISTSLEVEFSGHAGNDSGELMEEDVKTTRPPSSPVISAPELAGKPFTKLFKDWIRLLMSDEESSFAGVTGMTAYINAGSPPLTPADKSMSCLFYEPTPNNKGINDALISVNMRPRGVTSEMSSEAGAARETPALEMGFTAYSQEVGAKKLALTYLESLKRTGFAPEAMTELVSEIASNVADPATNLGFAKGIEAIGNALGSEGAATPAA